MMQNAPTTIDAYIADCPKDVREKLELIRATIQQAAPEATEAIKYAIPTFVLHGNLVHFAAFKNHIGFYPMASGIKYFRKQLVSYKFAKGSVQFPHSQLLPTALISKIIRFRVKENKRKILLLGRSK